MHPIKSQALLQRPNHIIITLILLQNPVMEANIAHASTPRRARSRPRQPARQSALAREQEKHAQTKAQLTEKCSELERLQSELATLRERNNLLCRDVLVLRHLVRSDLVTALAILTPTKIPLPMVPSGRWLPTDEPPPDVGEGGWAGL